jgi:Ca2+-binding RTX toxin-like protein
MSRIADEWSGWGGSGGSGGTSSAYASTLLSQIMSMSVIHARQWLQQERVSLLNADLARYAIRHNWYYMDAETRLKLQKIANGNVAAELAVVDSYLARLAPFANADSVRQVWNAPPPPPAIITFPDQNNVPNPSIIDNNTIDDETITAILNGNRTASERSLDESGWSSARSGSDYSVESPLYRYDPGQDSWQNSQTDETGAGRYGYLPQVGALIGDAVLTIVKAVTPWRSAAEATEFINDVAEAREIGRTRGTEFAENLQTSVDALDAGGGDPTDLIERMKSSVDGLISDLKGMFPIAGPVFEALYIGSQNSSPTFVVGTKGLMPSGGARGDRYALTDLDDTFDGQGGNDFLLGRGGDDRLDGGAGNDTLSGGPGDDTLSGGDGNDVLDGGEGNDLIEAGRGRDVLRGQTGNDTLRAGPDGSMLSGGEGNDQLIGWVGNDTLYGGTGNDVMWGGSGSDQIFGIDGMNRIRAGRGDDFVQGGVGQDTILGEAGNDVLLGSLGDDVIHGESIAEPGVDAPGTAGDTIYGGGGSDRIHGSGRDDWLYGGFGDDSIEGGAGHDRMWGGFDRSTLWGGAGNDTIQAGTGGDRAFGDAGDDRMTGGAGNDTFEGGTGDDLLAGGAGDDLLTGGEGNDTLWGGEGNDTLVAGPGVDRMAGGPGADRFVFDIKALAGGTGAADTISDFNASEGDVIALSGLGLTYIGATVFTLGGGAQLRYAEGRLQVDFFGMGLADAEIVLLGAPVLPPGALDLA